MTREELLQEFLEASKIDKDDIASYGRFTSIDSGIKEYKGIEGLYVELKNTNPHAIVPLELTYFHHAKNSRLKQWINRLKDYILN